MGATGITSEETVTRVKRGVGLGSVRPRGNGSRGPNGGGPDGSGPGGGGGDDGSNRNWEPRRYRIGMMVGIASILMMFTALASAYIVRSGLPGSVDWRPISAPVFVWVSTVLIIASSLTISIAQRRLKANDALGYGRWLVATLALGLGFLVSQFLAWGELASQGVYLASNPHSSFFYVLTGLHAVHLFGGILGLVYLVFHARRKAEGNRAREVRGRTLTEVVAIYWHFMDALWVFLFVLLFLWR